MLLHSPVLDGGDPNDEYKVRGRLDLVRDLALWQRAALWTPPPELEVYAVDVEDVAFVEWSKGEMRVTRWP